MTLQKRPLGHRTLPPLWGSVLFAGAICLAGIAYACWLPIEKLEGGQRGWAFNAVAIHLLFGSYAKAIAPIAAVVAVALLIVAGLAAARARGEILFGGKSDLAAQVFRVSAIVGAVGYIVAAYLEFSRPSGGGDNVQEGSPGILAIVWGFCVLYAVNYAVWRLVKSRIIKIAWWSLMAIIVVVLVSSAGSR
jgi:hypothetical protein